MFGLIQGALILIIVALGLIMFITEIIPLPATAMLISLLCYFTGAINAKTTFKAFGTASSSNIGSRYALFEAIHGAGLRIMQSGRGPWANPGSLIRAMGEMLAHIGYGDRKAILDKAMDICTVTEKKLVITGRQDGCTGAEFTDYLIDSIRALR